MYSEQKQALAETQALKRPAVLAVIGVAGLVAAIVVVRVVGGGTGYGVFFGLSAILPVLAVLMLRRLAIRTAQATSA